MLVIAFCDTVAPWGLCNCYAVQVIIIIIIWNFQLHRQLHSLFAVNAAVMMPQSCLSAPLKSAARHFPDNVHRMFACMCRNTWYMNAKSTKRDLWQLLLCVALRRYVCVCVCVECSEIFSGNVFLYRNNYLCYDETIQWADILSGEGAAVIADRRNRSRTCELRSKIRL